MVLCAKCGSVQEGQTLSLCACGSNVFNVTWDMRASMIVTTGTTTQPMPQSPLNADEPTVTPDEAVDLELWYQMEGA